MVRAYAGERLWTRLEVLGEGVLRLILNRPDKKNALSIALRDEVTESLAVLAADEAVKLLVLTGAGNIFSAGFDLREFEGLGDAEHAERLWASSDRFHRAWLGFPLPTLAVVNGPAIAGGFDLAVMCDIRIASQTASFLHPEVAFGDVVYAPLHDLVGGAVARDLCLTGRKVDAAEAKALGLVSSVVSASDLDEEAARWSARMSAAPRHLLQRTKAKIIRRAAIDAAKTLDL